MKRSARISFVTLASLVCMAACSSCQEDDEDKTERQAPQLATAGPSLLDQDGTLAPGQGAPGRATFDVPVQAGDHLEVILTSQGFDPSLEVTPPGAGALRNDDWQGNRNESRLSVVTAQAGVMKVTATSPAADAAGAFHVTVRRVVPAGQAQAQAQAPALLPPGGTHTSEIGPGDPTLPDGRLHERVMVGGGDAGPLQLQVRGTGPTQPQIIVLDPAGRALSGTNGTYAIVQPGVHVAQVLAAAGSTVPYTMSLQPQAANTPAVTPTLSRNHHQLPTGAATTPVTIGQTVQGSLAAGDGSLPTGEPADLYALTGQAGQQVRVELRADFDTFLMVVAPSGQHWENDDSGGSLNSALDLTLPAAGTYRVVATAYRAGVTGDYELKVSTGRGPQLADTTPTPTPTPANAAAATTRAGELAQGDQTLQSGEFMDVHHFTWAAGTTVDLRLTSSAFDTYLIVREPGGAQEDNDDLEPGNTNSGLTYTASAAGAYQVIVTSYRSGESGAYELVVTPSGGAAPATGTPTPTPATTPSVASQRSIEGALASGDQTLPSGEFADLHELTFQAGERVHLEARSTAFDTYLIVREPGGQQHDNDDGPGGGTNALIDFAATQSGVHRVTVTSYRPGEQGDYQLVIGGASGGAAGGGSATPTPTPTPTGPAPTPATGDSVQGALAQGDGQLNSGEFRDAFTRSFTAGEPVSIRLESSQFDPYLIVTTPSGRQMDNDDLTPSTRNAGVDIPSAENGDYRILVTSYEPGETGNYTLSFGAGTPIPRPSTGGGGGSGSGGRVFGIFAGITDYPAGVGDLPECANDAIKLAEALREANLLDESRQVVLTDGQATTTNLRAAFQRFAPQMGPQDVFVFFYSGHGGQQQGSSDAREIDGTDEYLYLHDGQLMDDEMGRLFDTVNARLSVVALDACFSGGFAKDVITRPGRIGFFSSEEDVLSAVAGQFQAGGYLSHFIRLAMTGQADMSPRDRVLTVGELSHFLYTQFGRHATDVQLQGAYQHLVVDRGAVHGDQVLWSYR